MKRLAALLLLVAAPLLAQAPNGWQELPNGWSEIQTPPNAPGLTHSAATDTTTATGSIVAKNLTVSGLATPGSITVTPTLSKVGSITTVAGASLVDGDYFTIEYAAGLTVPIEFDATPGDGTTGGRVPYVFAPGDTADQIRDGLITLLNTAAGTQLTASSGGAATVSLVLDTPGAAGGTNTENVAAAGFAVTGFVNPTAATTYTYRLVARLADGTTTEAGAASTTAAGHATLSVANYNALSASAVTGAVAYDWYRTVGGATQGKIASATTALSLNDTGLAGGGETAPTADYTGVVTADRVLVGNGTAAQPSVAGVSGATTGLYFDPNFVAVSVGGTPVFAAFSVSNGGFRLIGTGNYYSINNDLFLSRPAAATLQLGAANAASPVAQTLKFQDATGTNANAAATATVKCPAGTGTGTPGACVFQAPVGGSSGSTAHTQTDALKIVGAASGGVPAVVLAATQSPASNAACTAGTITWDASYIYICTASGAWKRAALTGGY